MRILITGGAASGKSAYAEQRALEWGEPLIYLATMRVYGDEDFQRVRRHREMRASKGFTTIEFTDAGEFAQATEAIPERATILLEDLSNLVSNLLFDSDGHMCDANDAYHAIMTILAQLAERASQLIVVGNEIGAGIEQETPELQSYVSLLGRIACEYAARCDEVVEVVCGIPKRIK